MTDIHCHILYGLDDGAQTQEESYAMLLAAQSAGFDHIVATPHAKHFPYDMALAQARFAQVSETAAGLGVSLRLGFEVHWHILQYMSADEIAPFCTQGSDMLLIEFHMKGGVPDNMIRRLRDLQRDGYPLIIAHPERYEFVQRDIGIAEMWHEMGASLQLDARELCGAPFHKARRTAEKLLKRGLYDYYATDAHCAQDYRLFTKAVQKHGLL